ncbi:MAG: hypothetical protein VB085_03160 [Peptococcaceae bacterium]|nr:hypothetical protein [Peptococcaceae bacterium]
METEKTIKPWRPTLHAVLLNGALFALAALIYASIPSISRYQWSFYCGFFVSVALGLTAQRIPNCIVSVLCGFAWALLYWYLPGWLMTLGMGKIIAVVLGEFICTSSLLFIHLYFLKNTWANVVPFMFCAVANVYASGGPQNIPYCGGSIIIAICCCVLCNTIAGKINRKYLAKEQAVNSL